MASPLLLTKLFVPAQRPELVVRTPLIEGLDRGLSQKLTLISAPAGFGKTTLVTDWLGSQKGSEETAFLVGWLSLDDDDNDPLRFLTYLIAALNHIPGLGADLGAGAQQMAQAAQPPPPQTILTSVINEIAVLAEKIVLVIDDYHLIDNQLIHDALIFLLDNLPTQLHLVITTREDPPLQISRLRTRGQLNEFRAIHLRFSTEEAAEFLNDIMGLELSAADIAALEKRTEGWVAGLQLAAISMQGRADIDNFIESFTGSHHLVIDYLVAEVLEQQTENIRDFLLQTSILDRLSGPLADMISGQEGGQATLEELERANLFIVRLDNERRWYRYHHLFRDSLRQRLRQRKPDQEKKLHLRASEWYEQNGLYDQAIEHALNAVDFERAILLIENRADTSWRRGEHTMLRHWLDSLPDEMVLSNPNLSVFQAWEQFANGQQNAAEITLEGVDELISDQESLSESDKRGIQGRVATIRAFLAFHKGDMGSIIHHAQQALDLLPEDDMIWRNTASVPLGDASGLLGDLEETARIRFETWEKSKKIGNIYMDLIAGMKYCITLRQQGKFERVIEICQQQMILAQERGLSNSAEAGWILAVWGEVLAELGNLDEAVIKTRKAKSLAEGGDIGVLNWCKLCLIIALYTQEDFFGVEEVIQEIEDYGVQRLPPWIVSRIKTWQLRLWLAQGKIDETSQWLAQRRLDVSGQPDTLNDWEYLTLARYLIATGKPSKTIDLLERMYEFTSERGHISRMIEILNLQAIALYENGESHQALAVLERSLNLAGPRGFLSIYINEGPPLARILYEASSSGISPEYIQKLLAAFPDEKPRQQSGAGVWKKDSDWIETLSDRELEVLHLIAAGLSRQEIASQLVLSLNTVKTHARNIFSKLGAKNQMQAVGKARGLGLLDQD